MFIPFQENEPRPQQTSSLFWSENNSFIGNIRRVLAVYCCWLFLWLQQNLGIQKGQPFLHIFQDVLLL